MTATVWKKELAENHLQKIYIPAGSKFLCANMQLGKICVWFWCDPDKRLVPRTVAIVGTGSPAPLDGQYLGTVMIANGQLVFHIFAEPEK